jgi:hypothetical protein
MCNHRQATILGIRNRSRKRDPSGHIYWQVVIADYRASQIASPLRIRWICSEKRSISSGFSDKARKPKFFRSIDLGHVPCRPQWEPAHLSIASALVVINHPHSAMFFIVLYLPIMSDMPYDQWTRVSVTAITYFSIFRSAVLRF